MAVCSQTAVSTSNDLNIHLGHLKTPSFSYTAHQLICLLLELYQSFGANLNDYKVNMKKTVINKSHFGLYMLIYQPNQHFPLFITCWIPSQWKCKDLNLFMLLLFLPVCEKSLWNLSLGSPSSRSTSCFDSITVLVLKARSSQGSHSCVLNYRGTGQLPLLLIHLLWPAYEYLTVFKRSN